MPLFRAVAKNMAPMTNADESPTNRLTLFPIYLSLFIVSTLCPSLRIESSAIINLRGVSTKLNKYIVFTMQNIQETYF